MTDEESANDWAVRATATSETPEEAEEAPSEDAPEPEPEPTADSPQRTARRRAAFAVGRGLVVLAVATAGYFWLAPTHVVVRSRLGMLVINKPGVAAFDKAKPKSGEDGDTSTGLAALTSAAKKSPNQTGLYSVEWSPNQSSAAGVVAFLFPDEKTAETAVTELRSQQMSADANKANSLTRTDTFTVPGVPGSDGAVFSPATKSNPTLSTAMIRYGRVVSLTEVIGSSTTAKADSVTLAVSQYAKLRQVVPGFSLSVTRYPLVATIIWGAVAGVVALLAALVPVLWRWRAKKRRLAYEAELASRVVVGNKVIVKHRR